MPTFLGSTLTGVLKMKVSKDKFDGVLLDTIGQHDGLCMKDISELTGKKYDMVRYRLMSLSDAGYIIIKNERGKKACYINRDIEQ